MMLRRRPFPPARRLTPFRILRPLTSDFANGGDGNPLPTHDIIGIGQGRCCVTVLGSMVGTTLPCRPLSPTDTRL